MTTKVKSPANMAAAIREILIANPAISLKGVMADLRAHGFRHLNQSACTTGFYQERKKLRERGLIPNPDLPAPPAPQQPVNNVDHKLPEPEKPEQDALEEAARFLRAFDGDVEAAGDALMRVANLQVPRKPK